LIGLPVASFVFGGVGVTRTGFAGIVIQWYVAPYTDNTEWYVALMLAAGVWGGVGGA